MGSLTVILSKDQTIKKGQEDAGGRDLRIDAGVNHLSGMRAEVETLIEPGGKRRLSPPLPSLLSCTPGRPRPRPRFGRLAEGGRGSVVQKVLSTGMRPWRDPYLSPRSNHSFTFRHRWRACLILVKRC